MSQHPEGCDSIKLAEDFLDYCKANPTFRFWQALLAWSGLCYIVHMQSKSRPQEFQDTFYWKDKTGTR